ncbi:MAG: ribulose-phosphate 3-epimerase [Planctomycetota bacterium]|nr:MAG: ribulose-phosphate 3-epimerase [Planctomycetota bacterium]
MSPSRTFGRALLRQYHDRLPEAAFAATDRRRRPLIAPSMLKCDFGNLQREIELLEQAGAEMLHLDVMDGMFVPNLSYGPMVIERMRVRTELAFDAHLMIERPERYLRQFHDAGCDAITIHFEATPAAADALEQVRELGAVAGLAINPGTPIDAVADLLPRCDLVLVMSVEPGFGGQKFMPVALDKLRRLRELVAETTILSVDGGIGPGNAAEVRAAGAEILVVGSAIFDAADYGQAIDDLLAGASAADR